MEKINNNNQIVVETYDDFGHLKSNDHGLEQHMQVWHEYSIKEDDPLSAKLTARWETLTKRDQNEMIVKTKHDISSDKNYFQCRISLSAYLNNKVFYQKNWQEKIPRKFQ